MVLLSVIATLLFVALLGVVIDKHGVPEMLSSIYYLLGRRGWIFQLAMVVLGIVMMVCLLDSGLGEPCLAFLTCLGLIFVGTAPRFLDAGERAVHKGAAIVSAVSGVAWCLTVDWPLTLGIVSLYGWYWLLCHRDKDSKLWLMAEVTAVWLVPLTYWCNI